uniref:Uncharacterized protein n=1 Tax=Tanacetum cinerariifolium TaxID=118510 RepID=A0A699JYL5_TANCI|nr:hypothetical protein [Tanacetum cinerariifolium]
MMQFLLSMVEPLSNMENPEEIVDDDDDKMTNNDDHINHTLIKNEKQVELMDNQDNISEVLCMSDLLGILKKIDDALHGSVQKISIDATNDHLNKKEKRAMDIDELHMFSDATLKRVLRKINVINKEARHGIVKISLSTKDKELMALLEEEIKERLKYYDHLRK